jgi:hypothetical protein
LPLRKEWTPAVPMNLSRVGCMQSLFFGRHFFFLFTEETANFIAPAVLAVHLFFRLPRSANHSSRWNRGWQVGRFPPIPILNE